jgi:Bacterial PH domain
LCVAFAWGVSRTTLYTLTNRRLVLRIGVALNKCVNLPLAEIETADLKILGDGHGDIVLSLKGPPRLGYILLWPHARSLRFVRPKPMLRAIPEAQDFAQLLFSSTQKLQAVAPRESSVSTTPDRPLVGATA